MHAQLFVCVLLAFAVAHTLGYDATVGGGGQYNTISAAVAAAPGNKPFSIFVSAGTYNEHVVITKHNVRLYGAGVSRTIITSNLCESDSLNGKQCGLNNCPTVKVAGNNFYAQDLTIQNNFDYLGKSGSVASPQALALTTTGDKAVFNQVSIVGYQDTLYNHGGRAYFYKCTISGMQDFIFGDGVAFYDQCTIVVRWHNGGGGCITAPSTIASQTYGLVFSRCTIRNENGVATNAVWLGRPWFQKKPPSPTAAFINTNMPNIINGQGWTSMSGHAPSEGRFYEYGSSSGMKSLSRPLSPDQARAYSNATVVFGGWTPSLN